MPQTSNDSNSTSTNKHHNSIEITISTKHLVLLGMISLLFLIFIFFFIVPVNQGKIDVLNTKINRLNDQIKIYEHNQFSKQSISEIILDKNSKIADVETKNASLSKQLEESENKNASLSKQLEKSERQNASLSKQLEESENQHKEFQLDSSTDKINNKIG